MKAAGVTRAPFTAPTLLSESSVQPTINLSGLAVSNALSQADLDAVIEVRRRAYGKHYPHHFVTCNDALDQYDMASNCVHLLARDECGTPVGSMRILDRRAGGIELDEFVNVQSLLSDVETTGAEFTRLAVPSSPRSKTIKLALWKAGYQFCLNNRNHAIIAWSKSAATRDYKMLQFRELGVKGTFRHPKLGGCEHRTLVLDLLHVEDLFRAINHPLYNLFFVQHHAGIRFTLA